MTLAPQAVDLSTELPGRTAAYRIAEVRPQVAGIVQRRLFTEGAEVRAGQPLYQIDPGPYRAAARARRGHPRQRQAQLNAARLLAERYDLAAWNRGVVSRQDNDNAQAAARSAEAAVAAARAHVESARIDLGYTQVRAPICRAHRPLAGHRRRAGEDGTGCSRWPRSRSSIRSIVDVTQSSARAAAPAPRPGRGPAAAGDAEQAQVQLTLEDGTAYAA